ncbi:hypothetical protein SKAU_G00320240 [Synaphobranchus kaupii]|uniref:Uncharacterized protein n=1 Tax=Synaphobranchus kaupii TaxID=118154 RepID=A0A9Q1ENP1_SYNKA|nr:hypothetical protein SKAU_G00320240 [Synaphobranchus kaupii]
MDNAGMPWSTMQACSSMPRYRKPTEPLKTEIGARISQCSRASALHGRPRLSPLPRALPLPLRGGETQALALGASGMPRLMSEACAPLPSSCLSCRRDT